MSGDSITAAVLMHIRRAAGRRKKPVITREFSLGRSPVRADLALLGDEFIGVEIKGPRDTLRRLPKQMAGYATYFDRTILVVDNRHLKHIDRDAVCGAAIWSFDIEGKLAEIRPGGGLNIVGAPSYMEMMTQEERRRLLTPDEASGSLHAISRESAREAFFSAFRQRYDKRSLEFWSTTSRRIIHPKDLPILSRFLEYRNEIRRITAEREEFWQRWADQNSHDQQ